MIFIIVVCGLAAIVLCCIWAIARLGKPNNHES